MTKWSANDHEKDAMSLIEAFDTGKNKFRESFEDFFDPNFERELKTLEICRKMQTGEINSAQLQTLIQTELGDRAKPQDKIPTPISQYDEVTKTSIALIRHRK